MVSILTRLICTTLLLFAAPLAAVELRDPQAHFFDQTFGDFQEELETAEQQGKDGILLFFEMDECPFCHRMKETVLNRKQVQEFYNSHFLVFPVDIEGDVEIVDFNGETTTMKDFAFEQHRVRATPVFLFVNLEGEAVARYTGATRGVDEFLWLGEYVVEDKYREMPFTRYKRQRRAESR